MNFSSISVSDQLKEKLKNSEALIVLITADSLHSAWIPFEAGAFWPTDKTIIPILGPGLTLDDLQGPFKSLLNISIDAIDWEYKVNRAINQLVEKLNIEQKVSKRRNDTLREFFEALRAWQSKLPAPNPYPLLEKLLDKQKWREADQLTKVIMLIIANRLTEGSLDVESIDNFPCEDLRIIDQLWVKYSNGRFGFSVQKKIYISLGGTREYSDEVWKKFCDKVGWRKGEKWLNYSDLTFELRNTTPEGHVPVWTGEVIGRWDKVSRSVIGMILLSRTDL